MIMKHSTLVYVYIKITQVSLKGCLGFTFCVVVRLRGIEPPHTVPETIALSTELQAQAKLTRELYHICETYAKKSAVFCFV